MLRLAKHLADLGVCSRREAEMFIARGWISVDGLVVKEQGTKVQPTCNFALDPRANEYLDQLQTVLLHKPIGYVSGQAEKGYKSAASLIQKSNLYRGNKQVVRFPPNWPLKGLAPAGRLDIDSSGLLVLTQDGRTARRLIGVDSNIEKEYLVRADRPIKNAQVTQLQFGLTLDNVGLKRAQVERLEQAFVRMVLREGRKRQIRRMFEAVGLKVVSLKRVRIGDVVLGALPLGKWRLLRSDEDF